MEAHSNLVDGVPKSGTWTRDFSGVTAAQDSLKGCIPKFSNEALIDHAKSTREQTVYRDQECVRLIVPGDGKSQPVLRVDDRIRRMFPEEYARFKAGREAEAKGTPLRSWPNISPATAANLAGLSVLTVEHLAGLSDSLAERIGINGLTLRNQARAWLEGNKGAEEAARLQAERDKLAEQNRVMSEQMAQVMAQMSELANRVSVAEALRPAVSEPDVPPLVAKRGRPSNAEISARTQGDI